MDQTKPMTNKPSSETPICDHHEYHARAVGEGVDEDFVGSGVVSLKTARRLERDRAKLLAALKYVQSKQSYIYLGLECSLAEDVMQRVNRAIAEVEKNG